jgi:hypothetical protein
LNELRRHQNESHGIPLPRCDRPATNAFHHTHTSTAHFDDDTRSRHINQKKIASLNASHRREATTPTGYRHILPAPTPTPASSPMVTVRNHSPAAAVAAAAVTNLPEAHIGVSHGSHNIRQDGTMPDMSGHNQFPFYSEHPNLSTPNYTPSPPPPIPTLPNTNPHHFYGYDSQAQARPDSYPGQDRQESAYPPYLVTLAQPYDHRQGQAHSHFSYPESNECGYGFTGASQPGYDWMQNRWTASTHHVHAQAQAQALASQPFLGAKVRRKVPRSDGPSALIRGGGCFVLSPQSKPYIAKQHLIAFFSSLNRHQQMMATLLDISFAQVVNILTEGRSLSPERLTIASLMDATNMPPYEESVLALYFLPKSLLILDHCTFVTTERRSIVTQGIIPVHMFSFLFSQLFLVAKSQFDRTYRLDDRLDTPHFLLWILLCTMDSIPRFPISCVHGLARADMCIELLDTLSKTVLVFSTRHSDTAQLPVIQ